MKSSIRRKPVQSPPRPRIIVVDDHPILRAGLAQLITHENGMDLVGQFEDAPSAMKAIPAVLPDLAIVDISLNGSHGIELLKDIKAAFPKIHVLILSMHDEMIYAERTLRAGGSGYISKVEAADKLLDAVRKVLSGEIYLSDKMSARMLERMMGKGPLIAPVDVLSDRELQVFGLIGSGKGTRQIAEMMHLSIKTIESHRAHIKEKLRLKTSTELVHRAIQFRDE
jgi:DNA-binding NarL/FixJ family response regulator